MKNTDQHIERALKSTDNMARASASPFLYGKIMERLQNLPAPVYYTGRVILRFSLALVFLFLLNSITLRIIYRSETSEQNQLEMMSVEYFGNSLSPDNF